MSRTGDGLKKEIPLLIPGIHRSISYKFAFLATRLNVVSPDFVYVFDNAMFYAEDCGAPFTLGNMAVSIFIRASFLFCDVGLSCCEWIRADPICGTGM
jgi:hypothetical protein